MEGGIVIIILLVLGVPLAVALWLIVRAITARNELSELFRRLSQLEREILCLKQGREGEPESRPLKSAAAEVATTLEATRPAAPTPPPEPASQPAPPVFTPPPVWQPEPAAAA